jgi:hypothetical protein
MLKNTNLFASFQANSMFNKFVELVDLQHRSGVDVLEKELIKSCHQTVDLHLVRKFVHVHGQEYIFEFFLLAVQKSKNKTLFQKIHYKNHILYNLMAHSNASKVTLSKLMGSSLFLLDSVKLPKNMASNTPLATDSTSLWHLKSYIDQYTRHVSEGRALKIQII